MDNDVITIFTSVNTWNFIFGIVTICSLLFAVYTYVKNLGAQIVFQHLSQNLISKKSNGISNEIDILYKGKPIESLSITYIALWNKGNRAVRKTDIPNSGLPNFIFGDNVEIFEVEIVNITNEQNRIIVIPSEDRGSFSYSFDFIGRNDGALFKVIHTKSNTRITSSGAIIDMPNGVVSLGKFPPHLLLRKLEIKIYESDTRYIRFIKNIVNTFFTGKSIFFIYSIFCGLTMSFFGIFSLHNQQTYADIKQKFPYLFIYFDERWSTLIIGILIIVLQLYFFWMTRRRFPRKLIPEELNDD